MKTKCLVSMAIKGHLHPSGAALSYSGTCTFSVGRHEVFCWIPHLQLTLNSWIRHTHTHDKRLSYNFDNRWIMKFVTEAKQHRHGESLRGVVQQVQYKGEESNGLVVLRTANVSASNYQRQEMQSSNLFPCRLQHAKKYFYIRWVVRILLERFSLTGHKTIWTGDLSFQSTSNTNKHYSISSHWW